MLIGPDVFVRVSQSVTCDAICAFYLHRRVTTCATRFFGNERTVFRLGEVSMSVAKIFGKERTDKM